MFPTRRETRDDGRVSSPRPSKEFANREEGTEVREEGRKGRDATSMIPCVIIFMRIIHVCVFIYNIYIHNDVCTSKRSNFALSLK